MNFKSLENLKIVGNVLTSEDKISFEDFIGDIDQNEKFKSMDIKELNVTLHNLMAFRDSVYKYGLTRSLISFADHDKSLSSSINEIPSIENLVTDRSPKNSTDVVIALEGKIGQLFSYIKQALKNKFQNLFSRGQFKLAKAKNINNKLKSLEDLLRQGGYAFDENEAKNKKVSLPNYEELVHFISLFEKMTEVVKNMFSMSLPQSKQEYSTWIQKIYSEATPIKAISYFAFLGNAEQGLSNNKESLTEKNHPSESIYSLGYTSIDKFESIYSLLKKAWTSYEQNFLSTDEDKLFEGHVQETIDKQVFNESYDLVVEFLFNMGFALEWINKYPPAVLKAIFWCSDKK